MTISIPSLLEEFTSEFKIQIIISKADISNTTNVLTPEATVSVFNSSHYLLNKIGVMRTNVFTFPSVLNPDSLSHLITADVKVYFNQGKSSECLTYEKTGLS